ISADGSFIFATPLAGTGTYWVTVLTQPAGQTCSVTPASIGSVSNTNHTDVAVACSANTYTIGGTVTGLAGTGLVLQNNGGNNLPVSANGSFTFTTPIASGATYNVTVLTQPGTPTQTCTVNSPAGTVATANVTNVSVICSTLSYPVGGTITGLTGTGLVLQNNGGDNLTAASGVYAFPVQLASGGTYNVTVLTQPTSPAQICTVANASGTVTAAVTNANVSCVSTYTIGGTITGAANGIGPTLQNNLGDNLFIPAITTTGTAFTFSTPIADGANYSVTQRIRARAPSQNCNIIPNGSGTVSGANVTNVSITCVLSTVVPKFAYVANSTVTPDGQADTISSYTIAADGQLVAASTPTTATGDAPFDVAVEPTGQFAYVANSKSDSISAYSINSASGALVVIDADGAAGGVQASIATGDNPTSIAIHPSGKFAYAVNQGNGSTTGNTISAYSIDITSGALSAIDADGATAGTQSSIATGAFPYAVTVDPFGKFVYVANYTGGTISGYTINPTTGALTSVGTAVAAGTGPSSIVTDPTGKCALVTNNTSNNVMSYTINQTTGVLTSASTVAGAAGSAPRSVAVDPNTGLYAYVANAGLASVSAYSVNPTTCVIAPIDTDTAVGVQTSIAAGSVPLSINVDPSGQFVYVANLFSNNISIYNIAGGSGALTLVQTLSTGSGPVAVTTTQ
ncbi:MAG: lactonase family protein, partial [Gallionella sp.]|nr:lactonase family protein [Gallionella sp.]